MSFSIFPCAEYFCECTDWNLSNLKLQKLLYFAQMISLGEHNTELFHEDFHAWNYGPVNPELYHAIKIYGTAPIGRIPNGSDILPSGIKRSILDKTYRVFGPMTPSQLIQFTHWPHGAWAKNYTPTDRKSIIPKRDIKEEYHERQRKFEETRDDETQ